MGQKLLLWALSWTIHIALSSPRRWNSASPVCFDNTEQETPGVGKILSSTTHYILHDRPSNSRLRGDSSCLPILPSPSFICWQRSVRHRSRAETRIEFIALSANSTTTTTHRTHVDLLPGHELQSNLVLPKRYARYYIQTTDLVLKTLRFVLANWYAIGCCKYLQVRMTNVHCALAA